MAQAQVTVTMESVLTGIRLDPVNRRVLVDGYIRVQVGAEASWARLESFSEDVTPLMSPEQVTAALLLVAGAQAWIDSKLP